MHPRNDPREAPVRRAPASPPGYSAAGSPYCGSHHGGRDRVLRTPEMLGYKPLEVIATLLVGLSGLWTLSSLYRVYLAIGYRNMIHRYGVELANQPPAERDRLQRAFDVTNGLRAVFFVLIAALFIVWLARAYSNLRSVSPPAGLAPTWRVVVVFVVPVLNLVLMRRYLDDLWVRSESYLQPRRLSPKLVDAMCGACIGGVLFGGLFDFGPVRVLEGNKFASDLALASAAAFVAMIVAIAVFVYKVTLRLTIRSAEMTEAVLRRAG